MYLRPLNSYNNFKIMKKILILALSIILVSVCLFSCSSTHDVVSNRFIQKRKYNKGFYKNVKKNIKLKDNLSQKKISFQSKREAVVKPRRSIEKTIQNEATYSKTISKDSGKDISVTQTVNEKRVLTNNNEGIKTESKVNRYIAELFHNIDKTIHSKSNLASTTSTMWSDISVILLYVLCFVIPFLSVGLVTNWDLIPVLISLGLTFLYAFTIFAIFFRGFFYLLAVVHALYMVYTNV